MEIIKENKVNIKDISTALRNGAVLVLPTDTVYGFVCDATNLKAVEKIFDIKKRDKSNSLPVFVEDIKMAKEYAFVDKKQENFLKKKWPGTTTVVLPAKKGLSPLVYKSDTIALRQPNYKLVTNLLNTFRKPLAQTSANISGAPPATEVENIIRQFKEENIIVIDSGNLPKNKPSTIIDLVNNSIKILRK